MNEAAFIQALAAKGIVLSAQQQQQFQAYFQQLIEWNDKINLTAITDIDEVYLKHFYDSLIPLWQMSIPQGAQLVDVGSGAGFPGLPLKIVRPDLEITIIDALNKRIQFLDHLAAYLGLNGVINVHLRAEEAGQDSRFRQRFDVATARAVAPLNILCELCLPLVKKGGRFIALKGQKIDAELMEAQQAIKVLGAKFEEVITVTLPFEAGDRALVGIRKTLDTPKKYPRRPGKPNKEPIK